MDGPAVDGDRGLTHNDVGMLVLRREAGGSARLRDFKVLVDGVLVRTIQEGRTVRIPLSPGAHRLQLRIDWCSSPEITFAMEVGETAAYSCRATFHSAADPVLRPRRYVELVPSTHMLTPQRTLGEDLRLRLPIALIGSIALVMLFVALHLGALASVSLVTVYGMGVVLVPIPKKAPPQSNGRVPK